MKKFFVSSDIEGTAGIVCWDETEYGTPRYEYFARQMSRESAAACEGLIEAGADDILVRDAHDSARNIHPDMLPQKARLLRNWEGHPYSMMSGLDETFSGVVFTGYHSAVGWDSNPLSHTMSTRVTALTLNGEICSELMINSLTASMLGVPVVAVTGDKGLCDWMNTVLPNVATVPVVEGLGSASISIHPDLAVSRIREAVARAAKGDLSENLFPMPEFFTLNVRWRDHSKARAASFYPGCRQVDAYTAAFESDNWMDVLTFMHWVL